MRLNLSVLNSNLTDDEYGNVTPRSSDGTGTNQNHPDWGATDTPLLNLVPDDLDTSDSNEETDLPNARVISNALVQQDGDTPNAAGASDYLWIWGQFLDHDVTLTEPGTTQNAPIAVPQGDPWFDPMSTGQAEIPFTRVDTHDGEYLNEITSFIDASMIYGSDAETVGNLRTDGGKLLMTDDNLLIQSGENLMTGDIRAAENVLLASMHTIFTREHNRIVDELAQNNADFSDDQLFNEARAIVEAEVQAITYNDFLPVLLGENALPDYEGYDQTVNPGISAEFSTGVFRFGHSLLSSNLQRTAEDGSELDPVELRDAFFRPELLENPDMIEDLLRGAASQNAQELDTMVVEDVRSFLFGEPGSGGLDLAAINIERGRDLGIENYNDLREALGLSRAENFSDVTQDEELAARLEDVYGDVDQIDTWIGGLAEDSVNGGMLGETFSAVLTDQFTRLRDGDAFWSEDRDGFSPSETAQLWDTTLSDVILRNTDVEAIQKNVFQTMDRTIGTENGDHLRGTDDDNFIFGGDGNDRIRSGRGDDDLQGGADNDLLFGQSGNDVLDGGADNDFLFGQHGDDILDGGSGDDRLFGDRGNDHLAGGTGRDYIHSGSGNDLAFGGDGEDKITAGAGNDILSGGMGDDWLYSRSGSNVYIGGSGNDLMIGGKDDDTFFISASDDEDEETDIIKRFNVNEDQLVFGGFDIGDEPDQLTPEEFLAEFGVIDGKNMYISPDDTHTIELHNIVSGHYRNADLEDFAHIVSTDEDMFADDVSEDFYDIL